MPFGLLGFVSTEPKLKPLLILKPENATHRRAQRYYGCFYHVSVDYCNKIQALHAWQMGFDFMASGLHKQRNQSPWQEASPPF